MATINGKGNHAQQGVWRTIWPAMGIADTGTPEQVSRYPEKSVQFGATDPLTGTAGATFGGATGVLEGSDDGVTYFTLKDKFGNNVSTTVAGRFDLEDVPYFVRPRTSGGSGTNLTVILVAKSMGR